MDREMDLQLKRYAQKVFEKTNSHDEFINTFHKNYL